MHKIRRTIRLSFGLLAGVLFGALLCAIVGAQGDEVNYIMAISGLFGLVWIALA